MANIGMADTLILMVLALVVFGPRRLPQIGRQIGKLMYEFRKASNDFKFQMEEELRQAEEADRRRKEEETRQREQAAAQAAQPSESAASSTVATSDSSASPTESETASLNPGESSSPDAAAGTNQPVDPTAAAVEAARLRLDAQTGPRIQPPSTGEIVATNRPGSVSNAPQPAGQADSNQAAADQAANDNPSGANHAERSEPASHHG